MKINFMPPRLSGFSIIEFMVALAITLIISAVVINVYLATKSTYHLQDNLARIQENGRYAIVTMDRYVRLAGFRSNPGIPSGTAFPAGYPTINGAAGEVIVRQFGSGTPADSSMKDCAGNARAGNERVRHRFYVSGGSLKCDTDYENAANVTQPTTTVTLVDNVELMTTLFGVDTDGDTNANYYVNSASVTAANTWPQVVAVQLCIVIKSVDGRITSGGQTYMGCDLASHTANDGYFHRPFRTTITLRNPQSVL